MSLIALASNLQNSMDRMEVSVNIAAAQVDSMSSGLAAAETTLKSGLEKSGNMQLVTLILSAINLLLLLSLIVATYKSHSHKAKVHGVRTNPPILPLYNTQISHEKSDSLPKATRRSSAPSIFN